MRLYLGALLLSGAPVAVKAYDHDDHEKRYYDKEGRDYHNWNATEDRAYREFLQERHEKYRDWNRASSREQRDYWRWRHSHPDEMLWNGDRSRDRDRDDRR
jgi:hypothetical protein